MHPAMSTTAPIVTRLTTASALDTWRLPFARAYADVFRGPPYHENTTVDGGDATYQRLTAIPDHITVIATHEGAVAGFAVAVPLRAMPAVAQRLTGLVPVVHTYYLAEMGVLPAFRKQGVGRALVRERLRHMALERYSHVVLRVSDAANHSTDLYKSLSFVDMGVSMDVTLPRIDGTTRSDTRRFLYRLLSQTDVI